jgi:molybdenum cofactor cytidylyltransferase
VTGYQAARVRAALAGRDVAVRAQPLLPARARELAAPADPRARPRSPGALICLGDMPWVSTADLDALIAAFARARSEPICVPVRARRRGNPVLWPARHFPELRALQGDVGARGLLRRYAREVVRVPMPDAGVTRDIAPARPSGIELPGPEAALAAHHLRPRA